MLIFLFVVTIVLLVLSITKLNLHPFLALILASLFYGLANGINPVEVAGLVSEGFGGTMGAIGIVVVAGVIIGKILELTGGAQKIADAILKVVGKDKAVLASSFTGMFISIPIFCDSGFILLNPIMKAISRVGKIPYASLVSGLMAGLLTTHALVPPTPGPVGAAAAVGANIGKVMLYGVMVATPIMIVTSWWSNKYVAKKHPEPVPNQENIEDLEKETKYNEVVSKAPSTFRSFLPIIIPIILIIVASFVSVAEVNPSTISLILNFLGEPYVALIIGVFIAFTLPTKINEQVTNSWVSLALSECADVLMITASAGAFGKVLQATPIGDVLAGAVLKMGVPSILVPYLIAVLLITAIGSTTVAVITAATIAAPMMGALSLSPEIVVLAAAVGSLMVVHTNSSYFWAVIKLAGFDIKKGYDVITKTSVVMSLTGLACVFIMSIFV